MINKESRKREDEWFTKNEKKFLEEASAAREKREKERAAHEGAAERKRLKDLHFMKCPKCGHDLKTEHFSGAEIDRCTFCEGIWVDAGELEEIFVRRIEERKSIFRKILGI